MTGEGRLQLTLALRVLRDDTPTGKAGCTPDETLGEVDELRKPLLSLYTPNRFPPMR